MSLSHSPNIVRDGLVLYLDAGNSKSYPGTGTTWTDLSGNGNNGTLVNGVGYSSNNQGSMVFDGTNDYINIPGITDTIEKTYSIWAVLPNSGEQQIFSTGNSSSTCVGLTFNSTREGNSQVVASSLLYGTVGNTGSYGTSDGITTGVWHYFTITTDNSGNVISLYIDAFSYPSRTELSRVYNVETNTRIGDRTGGNFTYGGDVGNIKIYSRALTIQEIKQNFNALRGRYGI